MRSPDDVLKRVTRIEAKLTRVGLALGLDEFGNPNNGVMLTPKDADEIVEVLGLGMDVFALLPGDEHHDAIYNRIEALHNHIIDIKEGRWLPNKNCSEKT